MDASVGLVAHGEAVQEVRWNLNGQVYVLKQLSDHAMIWHATFPPGSFVPAHIHTTQDEFFYVLEGRFRYSLEGKEGLAEPGDTVSLPLGVAHSYGNDADHPAKALFGVSPSRRAYEMFWALHNLGTVGEPADFARIAAAHEVEFLPQRVEE